MRCEYIVWFMCDWELVGGYPTKNLFVPMCKNLKLKNEN